jgi:lysozyme
MRRGLLALAIACLAAGCGEGMAPPADSQTLGQPLTICDAGPTVQGADLSSYQGTVDWATVAGTGLAFSIAKATEGLTLQDSEFQANWTGMKQNGIVRGAYHYFHSLDDGAAQADAYLAEVTQSGGFEAGDLAPFLDWEDTDKGDTSAHAILEAQAFLDEIQAKTGLTATIYSSTRIFTALGFPSQFSGYPMWVASRGVTCPDVPSPFTSWLIWQYSFLGTIAGMNCPGSCDLDEFNGTLAQLQASGMGGDGGPDGGTEVDAGSDAGLDAGLDAGVPEDAGVTPDAGQIADAGAKPDAGEPADAGAGQSPDAGPSSPDSGTPIPVPNPPDNKGCGCGSGGADATVFWLFGALALLRRRDR